MGMGINLGWLRSHRAVLLATVALLELAVGYLDYTLDRGLPLANLHFIPIVLAAFYLGYVGALATAVASIAVFHLSHFYLPGRPVYLLEADLLRLALFVFIGLVTARLADDRRRLGEYARSLEKRSGELVAVHAELARVSTEKSRLVAIAAHEVRSPLTVVMGNTQLLQREELEPRLRQRLQSILSASQQLLHTVNNILDRSSIEAGRLQLSLQQVDVVALAEEHLRLYSDLSQRHPVALTAPGQALALADREKIGRVLVNLLSNATKYSPPDRPITIRVAADGNVVSIEVADEGPGIAAAERERIFDAYYRSDGSGATGIGLGLAICKEIVAAHGGQIGVRAGTANGSIFYFTLPAILDGHDCSNHSAERSMVALAGVAIGVTTDRTYS